MTIHSSLSLRFSWLLPAAFLACASSLVLPLASAAISIDFAGSNTTAMGSSETAGVVAKGNWNNAAGASSASPLKLVDDTGAVTNVTASWTADDVWNTPAPDQAGNSRMMRGYLDTGNGNPTQVTVSGLSSGKYNIYVYTDGDNASFSHTAAYQISGSGIATTAVNATDTPNTTFSGTFLPATNSNGNYVLFTGVTISSGFTLTATPGATDNVPRAAVNGIQIIPVAPPADFTIAAATSGSGTIMPGSSATYAITIGALNGFTGTASLSISGLPTGAIGAFSPASITTSNKSTLTVTTIGSTPAGSEVLTITAKSGTLSHTATVALVVNPPSAAISIDFNGSNTTVMAGSESAGVVAKINWNAAMGANSTSALSLVNEFGSTTAATATWTSSDTWNTSIPDQAGNNRMMRGYLDTGNGNPSTVSLSGLPAGYYNIYIYTDGDNATFTRTGMYQISGTGTTTAVVNAIDAGNTDFSGAFNQANNSNGNYIVFNGVSITSGFTLIATPGTTENVPRAPINGIQIIPAAAPVPDFTITVGS